MSESEMWKRCSACKEPIALGAMYWACNVSTCNRKRTALVFCSVTCWEVHLPGANHREAWAEEREAPSVPEAPAPAPASPSTEPKSPTRRIVTQSPQPSSSEPPKEILIVASRLKEYVRARSGYSTSDRVLGPLSDIVRRAVDEAIRSAQREERMTVLDRDVPGT